MHRVVRTAQYYWQSNSHIIRIINDFSSYYRMSEVKTQYKRLISGWFLKNMMIETKKLIQNTEIMRTMMSK